MKSKNHVLSRVFAKLFANKVPELAEGTKTIKVNLLLFILFAVFAVPLAWAIEVIDRNGQVTFPFCNDYKTVNVTSGVTSFVIEYPNIPTTYNSTSCNGLLYVNVPSGKTLSFSGEVKLRNNNSLKIIDGVGSSAKTLYSESSSGSYTIAPVYTSGSSATVDFSNDGRIDIDNYIRLNVSVHTSHSVTVSVPWKQDMPWYYYQIWEREATTSGVYELNPVKLYVGRKVYMKKNRSIDDLYIWGVNVKDANGNLLPIKDVNGNLVTSTKEDDYLQFEMPESDVVVVPTFYGDPSRGGHAKPYDVSRGWGYNMVNESRSGVKVDTSIQIFDDGGIDYQYANNFDGYLTVNASKGHRLKVSGTVATETGGHDYLEIYEGRKGASATPICKVYSESMNVAVSVPDKCKSADSVLTLRFKTDGSTFADGLNLVVSAEVLSYKVTVNNNQTSYGTISSDKTIAETGSTVTLTVSPKSDYFLKSVSVINTRTNETVTTSGISDNKITFKMPAGNVKVTPTFAKETYTITKPTVTGGYLNVESTAKVGTNVLITANPSSGYMLKDIVVKDASGNIVKLNKNDFTSFSFTMPLSNVTITPSWTTDWSANGGLYVNMPTSGTANATIPVGVKSFKIYDDGGKNGVHSRSNNGTLVLTAPSGYILQLSGKTIRYSRYDYLYICDGTDTTKTKLVKNYGGDIGVVYSSGQSTTLYYYSYPYDEAHDESALDLTVTVIPDEIPITYVNENFGGSVTSSSPKKAARESTVNFAYSYNSGYLVREINAIEENGSVVKVDGGWYNNTASFKMPLTSNVTVTSTYTNNLTADGGLYINMPYTGTVYAIIPEGVKSFKVYDVGGKDGDYSKNSSGTLVLTAPSGYILQLSGNVDTYNSYDYLTVYDGEDASKTKLVDKLYGGSNVLGDVYSSGQRMTLYFHSDDEANYAYRSGLDLTVTVIPAKIPITYVNATSGGSVLSSSSTQAARDSIVNFTYRYDSGYLVREINAIAENGTVAKVDGGWYNNKTASFKMPATFNVTVTSTYTNNLTADGGLYINMPKTGTVNATIPEGVKSFKVYDVGGKDGNYSIYSSGTLVLTAPNGYVLKLSGSVNTYVSYGTDDYLTVYDGADTTKTKLVNKKCGDNVSIDDVYSNGQSMTLYFHSDNGFGDRSGLDLTVTLVKLALDLVDDGNGVKYVNMLRKGVATLDIPSGVTMFKVYDDGGKDGNYSNSSSGTLVLTAPSGYVLKLSGSVDTDDSHDYLTVCDGGDTTKTKLVEKKYGSNVSIGDVYSNGQSMTLYFHSGASSNASGLDLTVTLEKINYTIPVNQNSGKTLYGKNMDTLGAEVYLTGSDVLSNVSVVDEDNESVKVTTYSFDHARFTMPASNVTVTPTWATDFTAEGGLHLDMQRNIKWNVDIPSKVSSFYLYDNGGKDGNYENNSDDTLTITAPEGFRFVVTGSMTLDKGGDSLYIFDGETKIFGSSNKVAGVVVDMKRPVFASGRSLTFRFKSNGSETYSGINLYVSMVPISYAITIVNNGDSHGTMTSDKEFATLDETVTLTATPADGYLFDGVSVEDDYGEIETLDEDIHWYSGVSENVVSFDMPASAVTVTPKFSAVNNLYVNMPKTGTVNVMIPLGVTSFKVYDDGGESGSYSNNSAGSLVLIAPEGYRLVLNGTVRLTGSSPSGIAPDDLTVYNGTNINSPILYSYSLHKTTTLTDIRSRWSSLMLHFTTDGSRVNDGLDLLVTVEPVFKAITIVNNEDSHGTMTSDKDVASPGETVTLTATPDEGYLFDGVEIKDADGQMVKLVSSFDSDDEPVSYMDNIHWYSNTNTASFIMPSSAVTVTPVFTKLSDLYVNMPKSDTVVIHIPESVTSFKVYDDGGKGGNYSDGANGTLVLIPTDGWTLMVAGKAALVKGDVFRIQNAMMNTPKEGTPDLKYLDYLYESNSSLLGKEVNIEPLTVSQVAVMSLVSNDAGNDSGINLMVTKVKTVFGAVHVAYVKGDAFKELCKGCEKMAVIDGAYDGTDAVSIMDDIDVDAVVYNRSFPANAYSTILLPFDVNTANIEGPDAVLRYNGIKTVDGASSIRMKVVWATDKWVVANGIKDANDNYKQYPDVNLNANTPYLVQMRNSKNNATVALKVNGAVTIKKTVDDVEPINGWKFRGTWQYKKWVTGDPELGYAYGFAASASLTNNIKVGDFVKVGAGAWIRPMRAYLVKAELPKKAAQLARANGAYVMRPTVVPEELPELMSIVIDGDDDNEEHTTVIGHFNTRTGEIKMNYDRGKFDLKGRRVNGEKPNARGAYYGKKAK